MFKVGQKVWDVVRGEGKVAELRPYDRDYPVVAEFASGEWETYTKEGKSREVHENPSLYTCPVEVVKKIEKDLKPSINWEQVREEYKFLARDENGTAWLYWEKPEIYRVGWGVTRGAPAEAGSYVSYTPGTCDWKDSRVERP